MQKEDHKDDYGTKGHYQKGRKHNTETGYGKKHGFTDKYHHNKKYGNKQEDEDKFAEKHKPVHKSPNSIYHGSHSKPKSRQHQKSSGDKEYTNTIFVPHLPPNSDTDNNKSQKANKSDLYEDYISALKNINSKNQPQEKTNLTKENRRKIQSTSLAHHPKIKKEDKNKQKVRESSILKNNIKKNNSNLRKTKKNFPIGNPTNPKLSLSKNKSENKIKETLEKKHKTEKDSNDLEKNSVTGVPINSVDNLHHTIGVDEQGRKIETFRYGFNTEKKKDSAESKKVEHSVIKTIPKITEQENQAVIKKKVLTDIHSTQKVTKNGNEENADENRNYPHTVNAANHGKIKNKHPLQSRNEKNISSISFSDKSSDKFKADGLVGKKTLSDDSSKIEGNESPLTEKSSEINQENVSNKYDTKHGHEVKQKDKMDKEIEIQTTHEIKKVHNNEDIKENNANKQNFNGIKNKENIIKKLPVINSGIKKTSENHTKTRIKETLTEKKVHTTTTTERNYPNLEEIQHGENSDKSDGEDDDKELNSDSINEELDESHDDPDFEKDNSEKPKLLDELSARFDNHKSKKINFDSFGEFTVKSSNM